VKWTNYFKPLGVDTEVISKKPRGNCADMTQERFSSGPQHFVELILGSPQLELFSPQMWCFAPIFVSILIYLLHAGGRT
jgi:hypothetical protein